MRERPKRPKRPPGRLITDGAGVLAAALVVFMVSGLVILIVHQALLFILR